MAGASWEPLSVEATVELFTRAPFRWWISGGHALELHVGRSWRRHDDTDVGVSRTDVARLAEVLDGWDIHVAAGGVVERWRGQRLRADRLQNNLWCRPAPSAPWSLDVTIGEGNTTHWIYRRDPSIRVPWPDAIVQTADGRPYLAPELQLLFKSKHRREKDDLDAREVIPDLDAARGERLAALLPADHPWQGLLEPGQRRPS